MFQYLLLLIPLSTASSSSVCTSLSVQLFLLFLKCTFAHLSVCSFFPAVAQKQQLEAKLLAIQVWGECWEWNRLLPTCMHPGTGQLSKISKASKEMLSLWCFQCTELQFTQRAAHPCNETQDSLTQSLNAQCAQTTQQNQKSGQLFCLFFNK